MISHSTANKGREKRQHIPHASINLIEYLRCSLSLVDVRLSRSPHACAMKVDHSRPSRHSAPVVKPRCVCTRSCLSEQREVNNVYNLVLDMQFPQVQTPVVSAHTNLVMIPLMNSYSSLLSWRGMLCFLDPLLPLQRSNCTWHSPEAIKFRARGNAVKRLAMEIERVQQSRQSRRGSARKQV